MIFRINYLHLEKKKDKMEHWFTIIGPTVYFLIVYMEVKIMLLKGLRQSCGSTV